jgi:hypothetical protein
VPRAEPEHEPTAADVIECLDRLGDMTQVPTLAFEVTAATAPATETPSQKPCGVSPVNHTSSSGVQIVSNPIFSARSANSRIAGQCVVTRSGPYCWTGTTMPSSNRPIAPVPLPV